MKFRHPYVDVVPRVKLECLDESRSIQSMRDECDINVIVRRFGVTGVATAPVRVPLIGDYSNVGDFRSAMDAVVAAQRSFDELSADVRIRFANDPQLFLEFCSQEKNFDEMRRMGLAVPKPPDPPPP